MSKFQSTISVVAALASIFGAAAAGIKLAQSSSDVPPSPLDKKINQLEQKLLETTVPKTAVPEVKVSPTAPLSPQTQVPLPPPAPPTLPETNGQN